MATSQGRSAGNMAEPTFNIRSGHQVVCMVWLPGDRLVTGSYDGTVRIWNLTDGTQEVTEMDLEGSVSQMVATKDGRIVSHCDLARHLIVWNADTQQLIEGPWSNDDNGPLEYITLSHNEALLASCHREGIVLWEMSGTMRVRNFIRKDSFLWHIGDRTSAACLSPTGTRIAISFGGRLSVVDVESGECIFGPIGDNLKSVSWTHDGARIFCGSGYGNVRCFNSETGERVGKPLDHPGEVRYQSLSPDGKYLASGSLGILLFWDVKTNNYVGKPLSHVLKLDAIAFSHTGEFFAAAVYERHIRVLALPMVESRGPRSSP